MVRVLVAFLLLAASVSVTASPAVPLPSVRVPTGAVKQVQPPPPKVPTLIVANPVPESVAVPNGSYLRSCAPATVSGDTLTATCTRLSGSSDISEISVSRCAGVDIANYNGRLQCLTPVRAHWGDAVLPAGSWAASCFGRVNGSLLKAVCRTGKGGSSVLGFTMSREGVLDTQLDLSRCPDGADIANLRGHLTCVK